MLIIPELVSMYFLEFSFLDLNFNICFSEGDTGARINSLTVKSAEIEVKMAAGASDMYLALVKVILRLKSNFQTDVKYYKQ